jgi:hypothetical protein
MLDTELPEPVRRIWELARYSRLPVRDRRNSARRRARPLTDG